MMTINAGAWPSDKKAIYPVALPGTGLAPARTLPLSDQEWEIIHEA